MDKIERKLNATLSALCAGTPPWLVLLMGLLLTTWAWLETGHALSHQARSPWTITCAGLLVSLLLFVLVRAFGKQRQEYEALAARASHDVANGLQEYARALEAANRCLEEYSFTAMETTRAKSEFLAAMSHELRTPMTAMLGFAEMLRLDGDLSKAPPRRIEAIDTVIRNGQYLLRLINDILDLSKIEAGRFDVTLSACSPVQVVTAVAQLMDIQAREKHLLFDAQFVGPVPETIQSDPTRLRQILVNLVGNGIKFTERGSVRLRVKVLTAETSAAVLQFSVIDSGIGMTPQQLGRIFQPFVQADQEVTARYGGTGLGLVISRKLANLLGGDIDVSSVPGEGSTFRLTIPLGSLAEVKMVEPAAEAAASLSASPAATSLESAVGRLWGRVLLAEDGLDNQRLISFILQKAGAEVVAVNDGQAAVTEATAAWEQGRPFDVILMDMQMPILDGYQATGKLRDAGYREPIVALTARAMKEDQQKCLNAGCDDYAAKPIHREALLTLVARHLKQPVAASKKQ